MPTSGRGRLIIVSGPSGVGKTTVLRRVFERQPVPLVASISATTRPPRPGEVDGVDYHFLTKEEFDLRRQRGEFLECFEIFGRGYWYGTLLSEVSSGLEAGKWVVLEIDVQGALFVMQRRDDAVSIFVHPGSMEELERPLIELACSADFTPDRYLAARAQFREGYAQAASQFAAG